MKKVTLSIAFLLGALIVHSQQVFQVNAGESIQQAINEARDGDTVKVSEGTFDESLTIYYSIVLQGAGLWKTIITGGEDGSAAAYAERRTMIIYSDAVVIDGLGITQPTSDVDQNHNTMGILLEAQGNTVIRNCRFSNYITAIYVSGSSNNLIENNLIEGCGNGVLFAAFMFNSNDNMVRDNKIRNNGIADETDDAGVKLISNYQGSSNRITENDIENNTIGVNNLTTNSIDARGNWWGSPTGPTNSTNPSGNGVPVSGFVVFQGWTDVPQVSALGTDELEASSLLEARVYPNPARSYANLFFELQSSSEVAVRVMNLQGEEVFVQPVSQMTSGSHELVLNTQEMSAGIYLVNLWVNGESNFARLVVE